LSNSSLYTYSTGPGQDINEIRSGRERQSRIVSAKFNSLKLIFWITNREESVELFARIEFLRSVVAQTVLVCGDSVPKDGRMVKKSAA
jgi:hypothetical protein